MRSPSEFPPFAKEARYAELLRISYPIHPELFDRLSTDWSTLPNLQVPRLMADVVSMLWQQRNRDTLIVPRTRSVGRPQDQGRCTLPAEPGVWFCPRQRS